MKIKRDIIDAFAKEFKDADHMFRATSFEYDVLEKQDPELASALLLLGKNLHDFSVVSRKAEEEVAKKALEGTGALLERATLGIQEMKKIREEQNSPDNHAFILYTVLKNLEHCGLIKINTKPDRIIQGAWKAYANKSTARKTRNRD